MLNQLLIGSYLGREEKWLTFGFFCCQGQIERLGVNDK